MAPNKMELLRSFLATLPKGLAGRVAQAVETDRANDGRALPHDFVLDSLRPALRDERSARATSPMRVFCHPFEDLLTGEPQTRKRKGRISRASVTQVWNWLAQTLTPEPLATFSLAVRSAGLGCRPEELQMRSEEFWRVAGDAIPRALATDSGVRSARRALDERAIEDAREMAPMLRAASAVCELQQRLPRELPELTGDAVAAFAEIYERAARSALEATPYLPLVVMARLERPWEALRLPLAVPDGAQQPSANGGLGLAGEILFDAVDTHAAAIRAAEAGELDPEALARHVGRFVWLNNGMVGEMERRGDAALRQRLVESRAAVAEAMNAFMARAPEEILAALPMQAPDEGGEKTPDLSRYADPEISARALCSARALAGCRPFAEAGSFGESLKRADEAAATALASYNEEIVRALREATDEVRTIAEKFAAIATELSAVLFGAEEGDFLRRRQAAISSSLAA